MMYRLARVAAAGLLSSFLAAAPAVAGAVAFQTPFALNSDAATDTQQDIEPCIVGDGAGNLVAAWESRKTTTSPYLEDDIYFARSSDGGATWSAIAPLNNNAATDYSSDNGVALATNGVGDWLAVWTSDLPFYGATGNDRDIVAARSTDNGVTWSDPVPVNSDAATDANDIDERPAVAIDANGHAVAAWQTFSIAPHPPSDMAIVVSRSTDGGATWSTLVPLSPADSRTDWQASVAGDGSGHWVVTWKSNDNLNGPLGMDGDIFVSVSADDGVTWSAAAPLNDDAATDDLDDAEPHVVFAAGTWVTVWNGTGPDGIEVARSTDNGATWSAAVTVDANGGMMPGLATDGAGNWTAVWHSTAPGDEVLSAISVDDGVSWQPATQVNSNPAAAESIDAQADIAPDGSGGWTAVWMSTDPLGGTGVDRDILVAKGAFVPDEEPGGAKPSRCAMTIANAAGRTARDRLRCYARAMQHGQPGDSTCEDAANQRCAEALIKAEGYGDCSAPMSESWLDATIDEFYGDMRGALDASTKCGAAKMRTAGKSAAAALKCHAKALLKGTEPSEECLAKGRGKLASRFASAELRGDCTAAGDADTVGARVDAFVGKLAGAFP